MMKTRILLRAAAGSALVAGALWAAAELDPSRRGKLLFEDDFNGSSLAPEWKSPKGDWQVSKGVLRGVEKASDKHAAVVRHPVKYRDVVIAVTFRLDGARQFSLSLNGGGGHICRVIVRPNGFVLQKDKMNAKVEEPAKVLARQEQAITPGKWRELVLELRGPKMTARIGDGPVVTGEHPALDVEKADVGLPVAGDSVSFESIRVWETR